jgi:hypothetical protein
MLISIHHPPAKITGGTIEIPGDQVLVKNKDTIRLLGVLGVLLKIPRRHAQIQRFPGLSDGKANRDSLSHRDSKG